MKKILLLAIATIFAINFIGCKKTEETPAVEKETAEVTGTKEVSTSEVVEDVLLETTDELILEARSNFEPIPLNVKEGWKQLKDNNPSEEKYYLGKMLYFEPRISKSQLISCNTCHNLSYGGSDYQPISIGHGWQLGSRNAPTVFNSVYNSAQFWDGRADDLKEQAKGPIQASVEMAATPEYVVEVLKSIPEYVELFKVAFPGETDPITFDNVVKTVEVFEATLLTPNSKFDKFLRGDGNALNDMEKEGLKLYMDNGCIGCHAGINLTSEGYHPFGLMETPEEKLLAGDKGRFEVSQAEGDEFSFKAPSLRNVEYTAPYFHSGLVWDLKEAVSVMAESQLGVQLTDEEVEKIVAFLKSTTGEMPEIEYPILPPSSINTPKPTYTID